MQNSEEASSHIIRSRHVDCAMSLAMINVHGFLVDREKIALPEELQLVRSV